MYNSSMSAQLGKKDSSGKLGLDTINISSIHFANSIIDKGIEADNPVTHLHLHKLMYFVYGYYLARHNTQIGKTKFQPWEMGPVVELIYQVMRGSGSGPITRYCEEFDPKDNKLMAYVVSKNESKFHEILDEVWDKYRHLSPNRIIKESHLSGGAWEKAREGAWAHLKVKHIMKDFDYAKDCI